MDKHKILKHDLIDSDLDILALTETWLTPDDTSNLVNIPGYDLTRSDRAFLNDKGILKKGGGIALYTQSYMEVDMDILKPKNMNTGDAETLWVEIKRGEHVKNTYLCVLYRPPSGNVERCLENLSSVIDSLPNLHKKELILMGDFNIDYKAKNSPGTKRLITFENNHQLTQHIQTPTRITPTTKSTIDLIFSNAKFITDSGTLNYNISDHLPSYIIKKKIRDTRKRITFTGRTYIKYTTNKLHEELDRRNTSERIMEQLDPNNAWNIFETTLHEIADIIAPMKTYTIKEDKPHWLTNELLEMAKDRDHLYYIYRKSMNLDDLKMAKKLKNTYNNAIKNAKANYTKKQATLFENDPRKLWKLIKSLDAQDNQNIKTICDEHTNQPI